MHLTSYLLYATHLYSHLTHEIDLCTDQMHPSAMTILSAIHIHCMHCPTYQLCCASVMPGLVNPRIVMPRPWLTSCSNVSIGLTISEGVHDLWLPSASRIPNIDIMVWVSCSRGMSHFLILAPFPFPIILCIFFLFPVLCVTPPSITALPSSIPLSPPVCFYVTFVSSLFLHLSSCVVLCNIWSCCRRGETQSRAPNQPNQIHTTPDTEPRRSRTKNPRQTSCIWFNRQPILLQSSPIKLSSQSLSPKPSEPNSIKNPNP